ncbi:helix-turn-helix transcriptional regulator [Falsiroseomonas sp.]|uniref:helix-turn-helix transcriptional regulator n=1 Tax=Falsiroseomonas sp. TaxID=2870721 RepID=UPI00356A45C2
MTDRDREETYLDQHQLAARWGVSPRSLERWRWQRVGPVFLKIGSKVRYRERDIAAYEQANLRGAAG